MARLASDSFLPSGAQEPDTLTAFAPPSDSSSSVVSPLTLPRATTTGYFDPQYSSHKSYAHAGTLPNHARAIDMTTSVGLRSAYSPRSAPTRGAPEAPPSQYLSPHLAPTSTQIHYQLQQQRRQQRSASLSPTRRAASVGGVSMGRTRSAMASPSRMPAGILPPLDGALSGTNAHGLAPPASFSLGPSLTAGYPPAGATDGSSNSHAIIVQLRHQNKVIREAWEAERKYLEGNRSRVEEVFREERAIMEAERADWEAERSALLDKIRRLEDGSARPARPSIIEEEGSDHFVDAAAGGNGNDMSPESSRGSDSSRRNMPLRNGDAARGVAFHASVSPTTAKPTPGVARLSAAMQNDPAPFIAYPHQPQGDFLTLTSMAPNEDGSTATIPTVDVQEIHPELEGIPIKANAIKKPTFKDMTSPTGSNPPSNKPSPPSNPVRPEAGRARASSNEQTLKVLAAAEDQRLTMHAGHTPSHSLSLVPTRQGTEAATTASSSGEATPVLSAAADGSSSEPQVSTEINVAPQASESSNQPADAAFTEEPEPVLDPADDVELKGPLMVRNIPAKDEIFFRRLSEKLEDVAQNNEAPTVLKSPPLAPAVVPAEAGKAATAAPMGHDGAADKSDKAGSRDSPLLEDDEPDIPLKLKVSNNFGAPFGAVNRSTQYAF
jgi:hypothetical protein